MRLGGWAAALPLLALLLSGCAGENRYGDFALPTPGAIGTAAPRAVVRPAITTPRVTINMPRPGAVMQPVPGGWESVDVLNPSVVEFGGRLLNVYSAFDGKTWHTGVAASTDGGFQWERLGRVLSPSAATWEGSYIAANGTALAHKGELLYWYQAGSPPRIGLARSKDGRTWTRHASPVLPTGPRGSWDERGVADPYVVEAPGGGGGALYMFFLGQNRARQQRLGLARSTDGGVTWTKLRTNPILEIGEEGMFDENGLGEPAVWQAEGHWWMLYTGRDRREARRLGLAFSRDGRQWQRFTEAAVMTGTEPWNAKVICDPTVLPPLQPGGPWRIWYGGGDVAHPAENIHGQIGYAELMMVPRF